MKYNLYIYCERHMPLPSKNSKHLPKVHSHLPSLFLLSTCRSPVAVTKVTESTVAGIGGGRGGCRSRYPCICSTNYRDSEKKRSKVLESWVWSPTTHPIECKVILTKTLPRRVLCHPLQICGGWHKILQTGETM